MGTVTVRHEHGGQLARLILDAPKANILDSEMLRALIGALEDAESAPAVKLVVLEGAAKHFSFGASVEEHRAAPSRKMIPLFGRLFRTLIETRLPLLAAVRGQCLGGGMELACFCHWVFAEPEARFGQPEIHLGVFPPVAALVLPLLVGQAAADDLCLTGRTITAEQARELGLVHTLSADLESAVQDFFHAHIEPRSAAALRLTARASRYLFNTAFCQNWAELERIYLDELMETADANEGIAAFLEKRQPNWLHR
jgi:cyclohexa-1,5-dienecarbonyl-CoA hydratase